MKYFAVSYAYNPQNPGIASTRPEHREFISKLHSQNLITGSGPFPDETGGALIVLQFEEESTTVSDVITIMNGDPFWKNDLIGKRTIREWNPVINSF